MREADAARIRELEDAARIRARSGPVVIHVKDVVLERVPTHLSGYISEPQLLGSLVQTMAMLINEMPPGARLPLHRHRNESFMYILSGHGVTVVEGTRYAWGPGDVVCEPMWAWHEHLNEHPTEPVRYLGYTNVPLLRAIGINQREVVER